MTTMVSEASLQQLASFVADRIGLSFPPEKWTDLERGILSAARELGFTDSNSCIQWLVSSSLMRGQLDVLASHLTVGETYFWRDQNAFEELEGRILPELIGARSLAEKRLRIWSAGCCTGEEAYSLAIAVARALPDAKKWNVTIIGTDINPRFLRTASLGRYREWSFRQSPGWMKERYFRKARDGSYMLLPEIQSMVTFSYLNLAENLYPSVLNNTNAMDLILCRNVLMYFTRDRARTLVENLIRSLVPDGWLIVSPVEASEAVFRQHALASRNGPGIYRRRAREPSVPVVKMEPILRPLEAAPRPAPLREPAETPDYVEAAQLLANQGKLAEALDACGKALSMDKLNPELHFLRSTILLERGVVAEAVESLKRAIYIDPAFALAHFSLGMAARKAGKREEASRQFRATLSILKNYQPDIVVPLSGGITAARLSEIAASIIDGEGPE